MQRLIIRQLIDKNKTNNLEKNWKLVNFCEFDKYAIKSYCDIHNVDESLNLGDITKVDETKLEDFNMMTWGFPCTDISVSGLQKGFIDEKGEKTRSGMYYEGIRILRYKKPALSIIENVKNLIGKRFKKEFEMILSDLDEAGYNSYYKVLNAKDFGVPQNRERVFIVSIRKDLDNGKFIFPEGFDNGIRLKDILEYEVDEKYYISSEKVQRFITQLTSRDYKDPIIINDNAVKQIGNIVNTGNFDNPQRGRIYSQNGCSPTLNCCGGGGLEPKILQVIEKQQMGIDKSLNDTKVIDNANCITAREDRGISNRKSEGTAVLKVLLSQKGEKFERKTDVANALLARDYKGFANQPGNGVIELENLSIRIRKLTPKECFRLMGFDDSAYEAASKVVSNSQLYKQCGNSIVVDVLYYIFVELYKAMPYLFDDLKLSSFFSGIGAFESALDRLYESINTGNFTNPQAE